MASAPYRPRTDRRSSRRARRVTIAPMKYLVLVPDGCADEPLAELDGRTPLEAARMPHLARARRARRGRAAPR